MATAESDVVIVGGGLQALVCAIVLGRSGLGVTVVVDTPALGGMHRTEYPFARAPRLAASTGAHRLGLVPSGIEEQIGIALPLRRRDPLLFAPTTNVGFLLASKDGLRQAEGLEARDTAAVASMEAELDAICADLAPAWIAPPGSIEDVADRYVRRELREAFVRLCRGSFAEYAARFGLQSALLKGALAADALGGSFSSWDTPGSGAPLLVRHAAASAGERVPIGGMSALVRTLVDTAKKHRVTFESESVAQIVVEGTNATGVILASGALIRAGAVVTSADPWRLRALVGADRLPSEYVRRIDSFARSGGLAKLVVAFSELPRFACLPDDRGQHRATTFLLPQEDTVRALGRAFAEASAGRLPDAPSIECVFPTADEPGLRDPDGRHSASLLVPWVPYDLAGTTWSAEEDRFAETLLDILERFAPGSKANVVDAVLLHPKKIESHFGVTRGRLGDVDDTLLFADRFAASTPIGGLYACGRGCAPAGGVFGAAGLVAAQRVIADFELALERTEMGVPE
jgi:phytoene dehydrogenase-like protein